MRRNHFRTALATLVCVSASGLVADDNRLAWRLFNEGQYVEAGEFFSDPAWKGVAFYQSGQWWRALESFSRAGDADSLYNLGNTYVKLGYFALALQAYQSTLTVESQHEDARHNMEIIKAILENTDDENSAHAMRPEKQALAETNEQNDDEGGQQSPETTEHDRDDEESAPGERDSTETTKSAPKDTRVARARNERQEGRAGEQDSADGGDIEGNNDEDAQSEDAGGGAENLNPGDPGIGDSARQLAESEQATEQWLNRINDNPVRFLKRRIALEQARRSTRGTALDSARNPW